MEGKIDKRVQKTKERLYKVLVTLLTERPIKDITVKELSERADINRATFYLHYTDVFDLLDQMEWDLVHKFEGICDGLNVNFSDKQFLQAFNQLLILIQENKDLCLALFGPNGDRKFFTKLVRVVMDKCFDQKYYSDYGFAFALAGCVGIILHWLAGGMRESISAVSETALVMVNRVKVVG